MEKISIQIPIGYKKAYLIFSLIVSVPAIFLFIVGLLKFSITHLAVWGGWLLAIWLSYSYIKKNNTFIFWLSLIALSTMWLFLLNQTIQRIIFIIENNGMEQANGYGSPLAFFIGMLGEQLFFLPASFVVFFGWKTVYNHLINNNKT